MNRTNQSLTRRSFLSLIGALGLVGVGGSALAGCSSEGSEGSASVGSSSAAGSGSGASAPAASAKEGGVLVAYFSAQGHTKRVAEDLAVAAGADLFEVVPVDPYTEEDLAYNDDTNRTGREHADESLRDIALTQVTPEGWDNYDTVFVGYPIWWDIAAWPVNGFASGNDFTGKTVIPFCTSASSPLGESGAELAALAGTGDWQEGMRFSSSASAEDVAAWADTLNL